MDDNLWRSRKREQRNRKDSPYSPTDLLYSGSSSDDELGPKRRFDDIRNSSSSSNYGASSDDSSSSCEYRWEEAKPAKRPFQPFVTSVNVGKIELPAVKRELYAVIPLKAVLVILFPNNSPEDLTLGIKKLELHSLTKFEADLLTNHVRGLHESDIRTFTVGDQIYVAEFCRGEIGCSYESLKAKFTEIMNSLGNEVADLEQYRPVYTDIVRVDKLHIQQSTRVGTVTYPPPAVCSLPKVLDGSCAKKVNEELGKSNNVVKNDCSEAMQTGDSDTPCASQVQLHSCFAKKCVIAHVGEKIPEEQTCKKLKNGRRTSSEASPVNCPEDAEKETLPCTRLESKIKVAVVLKHLFPENEEDEESSMDSEDEVRKDNKQSGSAASTSEERTRSEGFFGRKTRKTLVAVGGGVLKRQKSEIDSMVCENKCSTILQDVVKGARKTSGTASDNIGIADQPDDRWESMLSAEIASVTHQASVMHQASVTHQTALHGSKTCVDVDHISSGRKEGDIGHNASELNKEITFERRPFTNDVNLPTRESTRHLSTSDLASIDNGSGSPNAEWTVTDSYICGSPEIIDERMEVMSPVRSRSAENSKRSRDQVDARREKEVWSKGLSTSPPRRQDKHLGCSSRKTRSPRRDSGYKTDSRTRLRGDDRSRSTSSTDSKRRTQCTPTKSDNVSRRKWRPEEMYGGSGQRNISFGDRNKTVQRTTRYVPDYSRLRFHYRPELYSPVSSSETDFGDIDDDDCICSGKLKQKVLHHKSSRDDARVRSQRLCRETSATWSDASSGKTSARNGTEQSLAKHSGGRGGAFPKFPVRRQPSIEQDDDANSKVNPEEIDSIVPSIFNEIESLIGGIRRKCEREKQPGETPTRNFCRISESPKRTRSRRRSHSPSCVRSFLPLPRGIGFGLHSRRRSLTPTSNTTKRERYFGYPNFSKDRLNTPCFITKSAFTSAKSINLSTNEREVIQQREVIRQRDGNTLKIDGGVLVGYGEGNVSSSSRGSEIHYSSAKCCHNTKLRDASHTTNAGVCASDELMHSRYCSPFKPFVHSYSSGKSSSAQVSMHDPTRGYIQAQGSRVTGTADSEICSYNILMRPRPSSDDEQVIILKDPQELDSSVGDLWPFLSVRSDQESSIEDSCDGEVEGLMFNKLTRLREGSHAALEIVETPYSNFVCTESTDNIVHCSQTSAGLLTQDVVNTRKSDRYTGLNQNTRDERYIDTAIIRSIDVSGGTGLGENVESSNCGESSECKLDPSLEESHVTSVPITLELKRKRKELYGDVQECDTAVDSPCAYEEVVMQDHDLDLDMANNVVLPEGSKGDAYEIPDVSEPFTKTETEERPIASNMHESGIKENFSISACDIGQNDETEALHDVALGQDGMCLGAIITIEGDRNERQIVKELKENIETVSSRSSSKSWKKLLLRKAQSEPSNNEATDDKVAGKRNGKVEQIAMCTTSMIARDKDHVETAALAKLKSSESHNKQESAASIMNENVKFDQGENILCDPPEGSVQSSKKGLELNGVHDDKEIAASTAVTQNRHHFVVNDGNIKSESSAPSSKKESSMGQMNQEKAESKSVHSNEQEDVVLVGGNCKFDDFPEFAAAATKEESESNGIRRTVENRTEQNAAIEMRDDTGQGLDQNVALPTGYANENEASLREGVEVEPTRNSAVEITKNSPESSNTVTIEKGDVGMPKDSSPVNSYTNQQSRASEVQREAGKRTPPFVTSTPVQTLVTDNISSSQPSTERFATLRDSSLLANDPYAISNPKNNLTPPATKVSDLRSVVKSVSDVSSSPSVPSIAQSASKVMSTCWTSAVLATVPPLKVAVPAIPTTVNVTRVTAVPTSSDTLSTSSGALSAFHEMKITVRATSQSATESLATSESVASKQKGRLVLPTIAKVLKLPPISSEQPLMDVSIPRRINSEARSSQDILGRKLCVPHSLIFSTVVLNATARDIPSGSNATLASRKTFRGPQVKHKSDLQKTTAASSDVRLRSSSLPDQPSLISKRPEFMSSRKAASTCTPKAPAPFDISSTSHFASSPQVSFIGAPSPSIASCSAYGYSPVAGNVGVLTDSTPHLNHGRLGYDGIQQSNMNCSRTKETMSNEAQNPTSSALPEKPLKSILRKPTVSFDARVNPTNPQVSSSVSSSDHDIPMKTFDERLQEGEDVIQSLLPLMKKRRYTPRKKRGSSLKSQSGRCSAAPKSSRGRTVKRNASRGRGRPKRRKRLPSISSDEDLIEELSAGTNQSVPKAAKSPPPQSEVSASEQEDGDEDLVSFMGVVSERPISEATEISDEAGVIAGYDEAESDDDSILLLDTESDSEEDMRPLSELAKRITYSRHSKLRDNKTVTANEGNIKSNSSNEPNIGNSNCVDAHENIFTKMSMEIQAQADENEVIPINLDSLDSTFANINFETTPVEMENKGVEERGTESESPASHMNECTPEMQDSISSHTSNTPQNFSGTEKPIKHPVGQDEHHPVSEKTVAIPLVASNPFYEMGNDEVQPILPTPPTSPKSDDTRLKADLSTGSVENDTIPSSSTSVESSIQSEDISCGCVYERICAEGHLADKQAATKPKPATLLQDSASNPAAASPRWLEAVQKLPKGQDFRLEPTADPPVHDSNQSVRSLPNIKEDSRNQKQVAVVKPVLEDDLKQTCTPQEPQETRNNQEEMAAVQPVVFGSSNPILAQQNVDPGREMPESREEVFHVPASSGGPDLWLSTEHSQEIARNRKAPDGISNLIAAAAKLAGLTDTGCNESVTAPFDGAPAMNHGLKTTERQVQEVNNSRHLVETRIEQPTKRKGRTLFLNYNMPEAESCHGFLEVCMSAPPKKTYALRRIPYVKTTTTHNTEAPSTSAGSNPSQDYSSILPMSSACATYLRLRDVICLMKVHPEVLFSLVSRCEAALFSPNEYTRRLFAVVYDPVCDWDENMSKMTMRHSRGEHLQAFLEYMIILDKFLHSLLPRFYFEALGVQSVDVPNFVNVKIFKPIPDINEEVVKIFRQPYEYNSILRKKDDKIKCNTMQRRMFSSSTSNARKRSHSSDSSGFTKVTPTAPRPRQAVPAPLPTVPHKPPYDDSMVFSLGKQPQGFYLSSEAPRFAYVPRNVGLHQCDLSSTRAPLYEKQTVLERPTNARGMNGPICFGHPNLYAVSQSQHSATVSQHLAYRGVSSRPYVTVLPGTNVIRYTGVQDHQYVAQNTRPMHNPQPYVHAVQPEHPLQLSYARNDVGATRSSPTSRQNLSLHHVVEGQSKEVAPSRLKNIALSNMLTTKEFLKDLPNFWRKKSKEEGETELVLKLRKRNSLLKYGFSENGDIVPETGMNSEQSEAAAKVYAMSGDDEDINLEKGLEWGQDFAKYQGTNSAHLSGVVSKLQSRVKPAEVHTVNAKRRKKDSGSKKTKAPRKSEARKELNMEALAR